MTFGSLFSGIGGIDLGFERAGFRLRWTCESDPFCRKILLKHWPGVPCYDDVRTLTGAEHVDCLVGGFPCQDISRAAMHRTTGIGGTRSGLWSEFARLICEVRPRYVVVENVPDLVSRGLDRVLADLAALGYDAEWSTLSACAVGAPHTRERLFVVAYPDRKRLAGIDREGFAPGHAGRSRHDPARPEPAAQSENWLSDPGICRVAHGFPARVDRLRAIGNAVAPPVAEFVARRVRALAERAGLWAPGAIAPEPES